LDVNSAEGGKKYAIPADNPFKANKNGFKEEIYAYGLRNPWRFNFDKATGTLWAADVGQDRFEEIDIIEKGGNYGWNVMEANECFGSSDCDKAGMALPIWNYGRSEGGSITGGYVCHDKNLPGLAGKYIYGDFLSGNIWALTFSGKKAVNNDLIANVTSGSLSSFGEDSNGNLFILNYSDGKIYKLIAEK
jgi:glucose/arabinose dehydrogenase